jgi:hypothetical protein
MTLKFDLRGQSHQGSMRLDVRIQNMFIVFENILSFIEPGSTLVKSLFMTLANFGPSYNGQM